MRLSTDMFQAAQLATAPGHIINFYACGCAACMGKGAGPEIGSRISSISSGVPDTIRDEPNGQALAVGGSISGVIDINGDTDDFTVELVAGQTYLFSLRGTGAMPLSDSFLEILNADGARVAADDDSGIGTFSLGNFIPATSGTYTIRAASYPNEGTANTGEYAVDVRVQGVDAVGDTNATAVPLAIGSTVFGFRETGTGGTPADPAFAGDVDRYSVALEAGHFYTFNLAMGTTTVGAIFEFQDAVLILRDAEGNIVGYNDDADGLASAIGFLAETSGTYYIDATAYIGDTGGYVLTAQDIDYKAQDPIDAFNWVNAANIDFVDVNGTPTAYVYFGNSTENFGQSGDDGEPMVTIDWNTYEEQQVMLALEEFEHILGVDYQITTDVEQATFRLLKTESNAYGAYFYPQDPSYGDEQGIGVFNVLSGGWSFDRQQSLERGGYSFSTIIHEFGHAHGLAHPHDTGGGSGILLGVAGAQGSFGLFDLNQGVYTVMSYNDSWITGPNGPTPFARANIDSGWPATLSAFDIATLQQRYGVYDYAVGNNVYQLQDRQDHGAFYQTIWDTAGTDTIAYSGGRDAQIDLLAATIDYSPTGGGVVSFVDGIFGGFTIANGVVIENATGGRGDDTLLGNAAANSLGGDNGDDYLDGRAGNDTLNAGVGNDTAYGGEGEDTLNGDNGKDTLYGDAGNDTINGGTDADTLHGGIGNDAIRGDSGNDAIYGDAGNDTQTGGTGSDIFYFDDLFGNDVITDFNPRQDKLDWSAVGAGFSGISAGTGGALLGFVDGSSILLQGVSLSQLTGNKWFIAGAVQNEAFA